MTNTQLPLVKRTLAKLTKSQQLKKELFPFLEEHKPHLLNHSMKKNRIKECSNVVAFRENLETGKRELMSANFCKYDRICIACATKRAIRMIKRFEQGIKANDLYQKKWYYTVLTIKHSKNDTLADLLEKLMKAKDKLARNFRNSKRPNQKNKSFFHYFDWMVISIEVTYSEKSWRHPHINILACSDYDIPIETWKYRRWTTNEKLKQERLDITWDSYIHNIRKINVSGEYFTRSWIGEVFKYAIKFSDLEVRQLAEIMDIQHQKWYRFFATYGIFRGRNLEDTKEQWWTWKRGVFLYDEDNEQYELVKKWLEYDKQNYIQWK